MANHLYDALFAPLAGRDSSFLILPDQDDIAAGAFLDLVHRFANTLTAAGVKQGDRVAVQVKKSPEALAAYGACVAAGAVFLPLNTAYTPAEIDYFLADAEPALLLCDSSAQEALSGMAANRGSRMLTLDGDGSDSFPQLATGQPAEFSPVDRAPGDLAALLYTSGTTGRSKGAMLSHDNLLSNAQVLVDEWRFTADDVLLHALPIFHTHGLFVATNTLLLAGGTMIFLPGFDLEAVLQAMPRATSMMGVPTYYTRLLGEERFTGELASHMRLFVSGSAPLLAETHAEFEARTGHRILERYGMTETNMNTSNPHDGERRAGTVGFPLPGVELRIADAETGEAVPSGEVGIIEVRGPNVFGGYWRMPEKTAEEFRADGFFITGDMATIDDDGYVTIVGRQKDLIITGGYNVYPKEVELVLDEQPGVVESAVIGVPHADFGEAVLGVLATGNSTADVDAISAALDIRLARYKQPKALITVEQLPRNTMGKVLKSELRDRHRDHFV